MEVGCNKNTTSIRSTTGELGLITLYYLLRVGECINSNLKVNWDGEVSHEGRVTHTIQFSVKGHYFLTPRKDYQTLKKLHLTDEATMKLTNNK